MTKAVLATLFVLLIPSYLCGQQFAESKEYRLSKLDHADLVKMDSLGEAFDGYLPIFIQNNNGKPIKEIKVFAETYLNDAVVEQCENPKLKNVSAIIRIEVNQCTSFCDASIYYWLITEQGNWVDLPIIENEIAEVGSKYQDYRFSENGRNSIELMEYQDEFSQEGNSGKKTISRKSEKVIKNLVWNGEKIRG